MNPTDLQKVQGLHSEICPASSQDAYPAIRIKAEVFSDAEEEVPVPLTFVGIKAESENPADLERVQVRGPCGELCPASSHDTDQDISIKAEVLSDAEAEEDPLTIPFPGIKAEPEHLSMKEIN
ncbi:uncharacterized protein LOC111867818 isoform X2 [Cryptotermes secundus]|uniref:uncharacterized protein LOC111867818 isoform X2 n=1 Tax=Cryptotermes secundus TaxID=105785 RepID=UPI000CD7AAAE|nr:uncharacterized protein LOC111867818 isoform X2 [Cryptotermes secundus]